MYCYTNSLLYIYSMQNETNNKMTQTVQLQSVGNIEAKEAQEFKIGESMMWNFGYTSEILSVIKETKTQIIFGMNSVDPSGKSNGQTYERRLKKNRLVAIAK